MLKVDAIFKPTGQVAADGPFFFRKDQLDEFLEFVKAWQGSFELRVSYLDA